MITPILILDSKEKWRPVPVDGSLALFGYEWKDDSFVKDGKSVERLNFPADMSPSNFEDMPATGYRHEKQAGGLYWQQFWTWWPYNPKKYAGQGAHEGDWEMVQIGYSDRAGTNPSLATASQHSSGEKREYWRVALDQMRPLFYVARDSHANYFAPSRDVTDIADGKGERLEVDWRLFGQWYKWPGKW